MVDFHTHILPGIDDGSQDVETSLAMLTAEKDQQVDKIIATPHFYAKQDSVQRFLNRRQESYEKLMRAYGEQEDQIPILLGAEVYYFEGMGNASMIPKLCIEGTQAILLEMPFRQWTSSMYEDVKKLVKTQKLTVILAHLERFVSFQHDMDTWNRILKLGVLVQMNAGVFLDWKKRRQALKLLKNVDTILMGSDCHNLDTRKPNLAAGRDVIASKAGREYITKSDELAGEVLHER
ncbi:MAG: capsular polysaccharide biosynthesis protein [Lachnospiraceae bacterium]|nr:capsular polysaccharide biosynthesis protein [Lachnospiraceae bacterium]